MAKRIEVDIVGDDSSLRRAVRSSTSALGGLGTGLTTLAKAGAFAAGAAGVGAVAITLRQGIKEFTESSKVAAQTAAVIKSTGGAANVTAKDVDRLSESLMRKSGVDDEQIKSSANMLLAFTNIRNEVGKGNEIFDRATAAVLDYSVRTGKDASRASIAFGKALNDPVKGISALTRVGIQFTDAQKEQIAAMVKSGDVLGAQKLVLQQLEERFGGAAEAAGKTLPGQLAILRESFNNFAGDLISRAAPALQNFVDFLNRIFQAQGFKAKLQIAWEGLSGLAADLAGQIATAVAGVDWSVVGRTIAEQVRAAIDASEQPITQGAQNLVTKVNTAIKNADWNQVGQTLGQQLRQGIRDSFTTSTGEAQSRSSQLVDRIRENLSKIPGLGVIMRIPTSTLQASFMAALQVAIGFVTDLQQSLSRGINQASAAVRAGMSRIVSAVTGAAAGVAAAAAHIGSSIVSGVLSGLGSLYGAVKSRIEGVLSSVLHGIDIPGFSPPEHAAAKAIGEPLGRGVINGWIRSSAALPDKMSDSLKKAIEKARAAIETARDKLGAAFDGITDRILRAFDAQTGAHKTATEQLLREQDERRKMEDLIQAQADAQARLNQLIQEGASAEEIARAKRDVERAGEDIARVDLEKQAAEERLQYESQREELRLHMEKRLDQLEKAFAKEGASVKKAMTAITNLMKSFGVDFESAGELVGTAFVAGLQKALGAAASAAAAVNAAVPGASSFTPRAAAPVAAPGGITVNNYAPITSEQDMEDLVRGAIGRVQGRQGYA